MTVRKLTAALPAVQSLFNQWAGYAEAAVKIRTNNDFTLEAKQRKLTTLDAQRAAFIAEMVDAFRNIHAGLATSYKANRVRRGRAMDASLARWEPLRNAIQDERQIVEGMLQRGAVSQLAARWKEQKDSTSMVRAWYLAFGGDVAIPVRDGAANALRLDVIAEYNTINTLTPEMESAEKALTVNTDTAAKLRQDIFTAMNELAHVDDRSGAFNDLQRVSNTLKLWDTYEGGVIVTHFELVEDPQTAFEQSAISENIFNTRRNAPAK